jgi:mono/diheme cytochrome c family protein
MRFLKLGAILSPLLLLAAQAQSASLEKWPLGPKWPGPHPIPRHNIADQWGVPEPYKSMTNPPPVTQDTIARGKMVFGQNCVSCHGSSGLGDGEAAPTLKPPAGNLAWLSDMPLVKWNAFMYWTIAEGGVQFGTAMPAFKNTLSKDDIWAVTAYIQARLPVKPK